jgi:hypothetical protein
VETLARAVKGLPPAGLQGHDGGHPQPAAWARAALLCTIRELGLEELTARHRPGSGIWVVALTTAAVIDGSSKLAAARGLRRETAAGSLGEVLDLEACDADDLYAAMDWLLPRQRAIEDALAARHVREGTLVLYDVSSAAFEDRTCPLGQIGHARDGARGRLQMVYGVLTSTSGIPAAVEVFTGATGHRGQPGDQVKSGFGLAHVALADDRGCSPRRGSRLPPARAPGLDHRAARPGDQDGDGRRRDPARAVR